MNDCSDKKSNASSKVKRHLFIIDEASKQIQLDYWTTKNQVENIFTNTLSKLKLKPKQLQIMPRISEFFVSRCSIKPCCNIPLCNRIF